MSQNEFEGLVESWSHLSSVVRVPHNREEYNGLVSLLDELIDEIGEDENHKLASLMEVIGLLIEQYEDDHVPELGAETISQAKAA